MKAFLTALLLLASTPPLAALLPPFYESVRELKALLEDPELANKLTDGEPISRIEHNEKGYLITTLRKQLQVDVDYLPLQHPGPAQFRFSFHTPTKPK